MKEGITIEAFTYLDYIKYKRLLEERNGQTVLRDKNEEYILEPVESKINQEHDKLIKQIFSNKKEAVKFINKHLGIEGTGKELKANQIKKCNIEFITQRMQKLQSDILYKIKETKNYILVEHQSTVDYTMPIRILEYCIEIIREVEKQEKMNFRKDKFPAIYPIVLYTGKTKWKAKTRITENQENALKIEVMPFSKYKLVDINEYTIEELLNEKSIISKAMLLEKAKNPQELVEIVEKIIKSNLSREERKFMQEALSTIIKNKIGKEKAKEFKEKIEKGKEDGDMVIENLERIWDMRVNEGIRTGIKTGRKQNKIEIAKKLLKRGMSLDEIQEITELSKSSIKRLK